MSTTPLTFTSDDILDHFRTIMEGVSKDARKSLHDGYDVVNKDLARLDDPDEHAALIEKFELLQQGLVKDYARILAVITESSNRWLTEKAAAWESDDQTGEAS